VGWWVGAQPHTHTHTPKKKGKKILESTVYRTYNGLNVPDEKASATLFKKITVHWRVCVCVCVSVLEMWMQWMVVAERLLLLLLVDASHEMM